jgi:hypothetical protein
MHLRRAIWVHTHEEAMNQKNDELEKAADPRTRPVQMTMKEAEAKISNDVYKATLLIEQLEGAGLILGDGHHMRQAVAAFAANLVRERWKNKSETGS